MSSVHHRTSMGTSLAVLVSVGALALVAPGSALAAPGSEGPSNCTFAKGTTICEHTVVEESSYTSEPDADGCVTTTTVSAVFTSYTAHRGTYNSGGAAVQAPPPTAISGIAISVDCP